MNWLIVVIVIGVLLVLVWIYEKHLSETREQRAVKRAVNRKIALHQKLRCWLIKNNLKFENLEKLIEIFDNLEQNEGIKKLKQLDELTDWMNRNKLSFSQVKQVLKILKKLEMVRVGQAANEKDWSLAIVTSAKKFLAIVLVAVLAVLGIQGLSNALKQSKLKQSNLEQSKPTDLYTWHNVTDIPDKIATTEINISSQVWSQPYSLPPNRLVKIESVPRAWFELWYINGEIERFEADQARGGWWPNTIFKIRGGGEKIKISVQEIKKK